MGHVKIFECKSYTKDQFVLTAEKVRDTQVQVRKSQDDTNHKMIPQTHLLRSMLMADPTIKGIKAPETDTSMC